jgi:drug/metabolite transporter (DMT)-like permease
VTPVVIALTLFAAALHASWNAVLRSGLAMPITFRLLRGRFALGLRSVEGAKAIGGGIVSLVSYGAMISALALGPLGPVSALRETSVVFSVLIGRWLMREQLTTSRLLACATVAGGAVMIGYAS